MLRIRDIYTGSLPQPLICFHLISDPKTTKKSRGKKLVVILFFVGINLEKFEII